MRGEVTVRWGGLDRHRSDHFEPLLSPDERDRAASFRFTLDRSRYVVSRGLLRTLLGERLDIDPAQIEFAYGGHGKPRLADDSRVRFNLAHSGGVVALAFCEGREIGIDVEAQRHDLLAQAIARRYLPAQLAMEIERRPEAGRAREFLRAWVRQEAYAKGRGVGLELIGEKPQGWSIADLDLLDGYAAAVAVEGAPAQVVRRPI